MTSPWCVVAAPGIPRRLSEVGTPSREMETMTVMAAPIATVLGQPYHELPQDLFIPPDALEVFLETFEGPLDLLLYLIRRQQLDILNLPILQITTQYMGYVELMQELNLELPLVVRGAQVQGFQLEKFFP